MPQESRGPGGFVSLRVSLGWTLDPVGPTGLSAEWGER